MRSKIIVFSLIFIPGIILTFIIPSQLRKNNSNCTVEVSATIVDYLKNTDNGVTEFTPVYEFEYNGEVLTRVSNSNSKNRPNKGQTVSLFINPENTGEFFEYINHDDTVLAFRIVGIISLIIAILTLFAKPVRPTRSIDDLSI
ncbi:MAG: hypothetical protein VZR27_03695 [Acutalibacteraceae bacterium]|nr:hypothetical protein [Clostridia bacterium]MEE3449793.1 hypothetical protein [Acutalibacteraceae bacterium]